MSYFCAGPQAAKWSKTSIIVPTCQNVSVSWLLWSLISSCECQKFEPQYHVVFDDLFQTVFSSDENDMVINAICIEISMLRMNTVWTIIWWGLALWTRVLGYNRKPNDIVMKNCNAFRFSIPQLPYLLIHLMLLLFQMTTKSWFFFSSLAVRTREKNLASLPKIITW